MEIKDSHNSFENTDNSLDISVLVILEFGRISK